ncbi:CD4-2 molecule, tandem duplicate 2, partial [Trichomycterus rosablanca]|uniref:CD4-2 molecule, tandem duplicate 2 n=1 Tax=Trichomycterus rosablanca TaxID=2290929 RepID=UPI002F3517F5
IIIILALCVTVGCCEEFYKKMGETVTMNCGKEAPSADIEWKHNNVLVIRKTGKTGRLGKVFASPSHVLVSTEAKLSCDIKGMTAQFKWTGPNTLQYGTDKDVTLKAVRSDDTGHWSCQIMDNGKEIMTLGVDLTVVGPLITTKEIRVNPGSDAMLPCILPNLGRLSIVEAGWTRDPPTDLHLKTTSTGGLKWNSTSDFKTRFTLSDKPLSTVFNVTMKKVEHADAGMYVCTLVFEGGKNLNATLNVVVEGKRVSDPKVKSANNDKGILQKSVLGVGLWVWIAVGGSSLLLIGLVVVIVQMHRRNKRIKRQIRKMKSTRQSLEPRNYCQCDRPAKQPRAGKGVRPPPLPRQHYNALTD